MTKVNVPIGPTLDLLLNAGDFVPPGFANNYTVIDAFDNPKGKFGDMLGNVALIDCHYANAIFSSTYKESFMELVRETPFYYVFLANIDLFAENTIASMNFCKYALTVHGALQNQVDIYSGTKENMELQLAAAGNKMIDELSVSSNVTVVTPLK